MMMAVGFPEVMASFGGAVIVAFAAIAIGWLCYCVYSVARAADALERMRLLGIKVFRDGREVRL